MVGLLLAVSRPSAEMAVSSPRVACERWKAAGPYLCVASSRLRSPTDLSWEPQLGMSGVGLRA